MPQLTESSTNPVVETRATRKTARRYRLSRRSLLFTKLRSLTARIWSRFPLFHSAPPPALPSGAAQPNEPETATSSAKIFPSRPKKRRRGRPEGTKGAGSRLV